MGKLSYGATGTEAVFDDRLLAHLKSVIVAKLRRDEKFTLSWDNGVEHQGRCAVWLHPAIELQFQFDGRERTPLNRGWIEQLMASANSADGLRAIPEPTES
ncbi:MAG: ATP-dependent ligase [Subtercola sp.]|nr:ATP-dependent ligase [Subtercola sp.]